MLYVFYSMDTDGECTDPVNSIFKGEIENFNEDKEREIYVKEYEQKDLDDSFGKWLAKKYDLKKVKFNQMTDAYGDYVC